MGGLCLVCGRCMVIARGNLCLTCHNTLDDRRKNDEQSEMINETLGDFSMFDNGPKPFRFVRRRDNRKQRKLK